MYNTIVTLKKGEGRTIKSGGAWIFDNEIETIMGRFTNGDIVTVHDFDGYPMGNGFINQNSKIRIRMMTRKADQVIDHDFLTMRVKNAWDYRKTTVDTSSCRIIFGEADFLPGLVIDKYEDVEIEILDFLDGKSQIDHHVIITTSNNTEEIPDTFLRPSRLDLHIEIPLPNEEIRREYFIKKNIPEDKLDEIITETDDMSLADLKELYICVFVLDYTIEDAVEKIRSPRTKKNYLSANKKPTSLL